MIVYVSQRHEVQVHLEREIGRECEKTESGMATGPGTGARDGAGANAREQQQQQNTQSSSDMRSVSCAPDRQTHHAVA